jgi:hypothetical protein
MCVFGLLVCCCGIWEEKWIRAFLIGFVVSFPTSMLLVPVVKKMVDKLTG